MFNYKPKCFGNYGTCGKLFGCGYVDECIDESNQNCLGTFCKLTDNEPPKSLKQLKEYTITAYAEDYSEIKVELTNKEVKLIASIFKKLEDNRCKFAPSFKIEDSNGNIYKED